MNVGDPGRRGRCTMPVTPDLPGRFSVQLLDGHWFIGQVGAVQRIEDAQWLANWLAANGASGHESSTSPATASSSAGLPSSSTSVRPRPASSAKRRDRRDRPRTDPAGDWPARLWVARALRYRSGAPDHRGRRWPYSVRPVVRLVAGGTGTERATPAQRYGRPMNRTGARPTGSSPPRSGATPPPRWTGTSPRARPGRPATRCGRWCTARRTSPSWFRPSSGCRPATC